jgi:tubulin beta
MVAAGDARHGVHLNGSAHFGGRVPSKEADGETLNVQSRNASNGAEQMRNNACNIPPRGVKTAAAFVGDTTASGEPFARDNSQFGKMYARRTFIHWYVNKNLETVEFDEARSNMTDLSRSTRCTRPLELATPDRVTGTRRRRIDG